MEITEVSNMGQNIQNYITQQVQDVAGRAVGTGKVQKFMDTFSTQFNANASPSAVTDAMVTIYAKNFSMEDIQGLIQFYETPLGKRVVKALPEVSQQSQRMGVEMEQNAALTVLRGMSTEYPEIKPMLPADDGKPAENAPATNAAPAPKPAPAPATLLLPSQLHRNNNGHGYSALRRTMNGYPKLPTVANLLDVKRGAKHGDREMRQQRRVIVELNPTNHAVFLEILGDFGFVDFEMFG